MSRFTPPYPLKYTLQEFHEEGHYTTIKTPLIAVVVAYFLDQIEFVEAINAALTWDQSQWRVSPGNLAKAIVLLPFIYPGPRLPIYSISDRYKEVDPDILFTTEVRAEWLTRDAFSCMLDRFFAADCERLFATLALRVYTVFSIPFQLVLHGDTTSISLYGTYERTEKTSPSAPIICHGHSKEKRDDLVQLMLGLVCDPLGIPLITTTRDGNEADCTWNNDVIQRLAELDPFSSNDITYIADSKLATAPNIQKLLENEFRFITRTPANFSKKMAERVTEAAYKADDAWIPIGSYRKAGGDVLETYDVQEFTKRTDGGVSCRFLVFRSNHRRNQFEAELPKKQKKFAAALKNVTQKRFACETDAKRALKEARKNLRKHRLWKVDLTIETIVTEKNPRGRPGKNPRPKIQVTEWVIRAGEPQLQQNVYLAELRKVESFVLMTNVSEEDAPAKEILRIYKGQKRVEDNFSVVKGPTIVDTIYLKKPERITALVTLLAVSLLIQVVIRVLVRRNLDVMPEPPGLDHGCKPLIRPGLKKILRFIGYHS
ncbi:MAG: IS1634 family transposase, partial [Methanomicrobiales archaeon]|nr:IS1634 family transposase [Methanomicrobiales archaeon]